MKTIDIISDARSIMLKELVATRGGIHKFCEENGEGYAATHACINKVIRMGDKTACRLEQVLDVSQGYFDRKTAREHVTYIPVIPNTIEPKETVANLIRKADDSIMLENSMIDRLGGNYGSLLVVITKDDAMDPTIKEGAKVVVDRSQTTIQDNKIYALRVSEAIYLRRMMRSISTGNLIAISDSVTFHNNKNHENQELLHNDFEIIGRAVLLREILV